MKKEFQKVCAITLNSYENKISPVSILSKRNVKSNGIIFETQVSFEISTKLSTFPNPAEVERGEKKRGKFYFEQRYGVWR